MILGDLSDAQVALLTLRPFEVVPRLGALASREERAAADTMTRLLRYLISDELGRRGLAEDSLAELAAHAEPIDPSVILRRAQAASPEAMGFKRIP